MTTRSYELQVHTNYKIVQTTISYKHKILQTQNRILLPVTGGTDMWPVHARTILPPCLYGIASMLVWSCLHDHTVLPPFSYGISPLPFLLTVKGGSELWPVHACTVLHLTLSGYVDYDDHRTNTRSYISHGHRWYWPVTFPGTYGIAPYPLWVRRCDHRNLELSTNLQFWFDSSDSSCANSRPLYFNRWDYCPNISHRGGINSTTCTLLYTKSKKIEKRFYIQKVRHFSKSKTIPVTFLYSKSPTLYFTQFFMKFLKLAFIFEMHDTLYYVTF